MIEKVKKGVAMIMMVGILLLSGGGRVYGEEQANVGIGFNDSPTKLPDTKLPDDNTPKAGVQPSVTKGPLLPQTGEMMTHLGILISGMIVIILMFVMVLDKQIHLSED
ncbi:hypothetical protein [uncultured Vagococcus sp.]|uniref:hypothetical protein n=1 Tax=uncultured Vagococcus sp. TaxID=189676 RepID=UPI0028D0FB79|nr:hypothetical protein [uncultured Vagococcus sp.]